MQLPLSARHQQMEQDRVSVLFISSSNWRGEPLRDYETIVNLIANTTTAKGLKVTCRLDCRKYLTGRRVSDQEMERVNLERDKFNDEWNYTVRRNSKRWVETFVYYQGLKEKCASP